MNRATKALAALAALAASASAAHPAPAAVDCSRHIRVGVFDDANPFAASFLTGWMDSATACYSFHHMSTGNCAIELLANGDLEFAIVGSTPLTSAVTRGVNLRSYQRVHRLPRRRTPPWVREASTAGRSSGRRSRTWMRNFA